VTRAEDALIWRMGVCVCVCVCARVCVRVRACSHVENGGVCVCFEIGENSVYLR